MSVSIVTQVLSFVVLGYVCSQEYYEAHYSTKLSEIPKKFEVRSININGAKSDFEKYASQIQRLAKKENATVIYKVNVELLKPYKKKSLSKFLKDGKTKKYNVPLKKTSMKVSHFESFLRKMAEQNNHIINPQNFDVYMPSTTQSQRIVVTKQIKMKYKPIPSKLNNFTKNIKP
ncbi:Site-specific recombinase (Resolvase family), partial [Operophtera brumata]